MSKINKIIIYILLSILTITAIVSILFCLFYKTTLENIKIQDENIVFFGDSITEGYNVKEFFEEYHVVNSGVSGDTTKNLINRIEKDLYDYNPSLVIIQIGTNDLRASIDDKEIVSNIEKIIRGIKRNRKNADVLVISIYPINREMDENYWKDLNIDYSNDHIKKVNKKIEKMCIKNNIQFIDVYSSLTDNNGNLKETYSQEGLHITDLGYYKITKEIKKHIK